MAHSHHGPALPAPPHRPSAHDPGTPAGS
jgi:hypothetical protein